MSCDFEKLASGSGDVECEQRREARGRYADTQKHTPTQTRPTRCKARPLHIPEPAANLPLVCAVGAVASVSIGLAL
eukprot:3168656-Rhodomonas_salina.1